NIVDRLGETSITVRPGTNMHGVEFKLAQDLQAAGYAVQNVAKWAVSGSGLGASTSIVRWEVEAAELYTDAVTWALARQVEQGKAFDVVVWLQGETDALVESASHNFAHNLDLVARGLRTDLGNANLIVVCARLNSACATAGVPWTYLDVTRERTDQWEDMNPALNRSVSMDGIAMASDTTHYLTLGYDAIAERIAERLVKSLDYTWTPSVESSTTSVAVSALVGADTLARTQAVAVTQIEPTDHANAKYWWDGKTGVVGDPVDDWTDRVASLVLTHASDAARPAAAAGGGYTADAATKYLRASGVDLATQRWMHSAATFFFVIDRDDDTASKYIFNTKDLVATNTGIAIYTTTGGYVGVYVGNGSGTHVYSVASPIRAFPSDRCRTVGVSLDAVDLRIYIDGILVATDTTPVGALATTTNAQNQINAIGTTAKLTMTLREQAMYDRKLTAAEIAQLHWHANSEGYLS
ncbi:MAG TPA: sialate O-acetylesterase, partial [Gemmatimonadaceae bacterium]|nr:sialate O-acetylesterase [Gemmatimonadaceae bacterium]